MTQPIRWGILSTASIANAFASDLPRVKDAELLAVASRTLQKADNFGDKYDIPRRYGSYEDLVADEDIDAIYVATPHGRHYADAMLCLRAGKAVLCEKAFTLNAREARSLINYARAHDIFLMEAMWTRFIPAVQHAQQLVADGTIGDVRSLQAEFGFKAPYDPDSRLFNPELGGGALLDIGIYPMTLLYLFLGAPESMTSSAILGETGVDEQSGIVLQYSNETTASINMSMRVRMNNTATIYGTKGYIRLHGNFWHAKAFDLVIYDQKEETIPVPYDGGGYQFEIEEATRCLQEGKLESDIAPLDETLEIMQLLDALRADWGVRYPHEM